MSGKAEARRNLLESICVTLRQAGSRVRTVMYKHSTFISSEAILKTSVDVFLLKVLSVHGIYLRHDFSLQCLSIVSMQSCIIDSVKHLCSFYFS